MVATGVPTWFWFCDAVAPGARRKFPITTRSSSKVTLQPSTNTGSPGCAGLNGRPATPSTSPEKVTSMEPGLLGAVAVQPGSQDTMRAVLGSGWHLGMLLGVVGLP